MSGVTVLLMDEGNKVISQQVIESSRKINVAEKVETKPEQKSDETETQEQIPAIITTITKITRKPKDRPVKAVANRLEAPIG